MIGPTGRPLGMHHHRQGPRALPRRGEGTEPGSVALDVRGEEASRRDYPGGSAKELPISEVFHQRQGDAAGLLGQHSRLGGSQVHEW